MKKFLILSLILISPAFADIKQFYNDIEICDKNMNTTISNPDTGNTQDMNKIVEKSTGCYIKVANKVIDTYYKSSAKQMKSDLSAFVKNAFKLNKSIYQNLDSCEGDCGTLSENITYGETAKDIKNHIISMLKYVEEM